MKIKVNFAPENPEHNIYKIGTYAIYTKKHWWSKWKVVGTMRYADYKQAIYDAKNIPPIIIKRYEQ